MAVHPAAPPGGLHDATAPAADGKVLVEVDTAPGVLVETVGRDDPRIGVAGKLTDRVSARAHASFATATADHGSC